MVRASTTFAPIDEQHIDFMRAVLVAIQATDLPLVLKGGTALLFGHALTRFSEDLDFDYTRAVKVHSNIPVKVNLKKAMQSRFGDRGQFTVEDADYVKDTNTAKRFKIHYTGPEGENWLTIDLSLRGENISPDMMETVDGILMYTLPNLISGKLNAAAGRTKIRDLHDAHFLAKTYPEAFDAELAEKLYDLTRDPQGLYDKFEPDRKADALLHDLDTMTTVLELEEMADEIWARVQAGHVESAN